MIEEVADRLQQRQGAAEAKVRLIDGEQDQTSARHGFSLPEYPSGSGTGGFPGGVASGTHWTLTTRRGDPPTRTVKSDG